MVWSHSAALSSRTCSQTVLFMLSQEALLRTSLLELSDQERLAQVLHILADACRHAGVLPITTLQLLMSCLIDGHDISAESLNLMIEIMTSACCTSRRLVIKAHAQSIQQLLATFYHRAGVNTKTLDSLIDIVSTL